MYSGRQKRAISSTMSKVEIVKDIHLQMQNNFTDLENYTKSLVNADLLYANFTNTTFQKVPISHLTCTMKQKFFH